MPLRLDAKPDNQFGQSFLKGFNKPAHTPPSKSLFLFHSEKSLMPLRWDAKPDNQFGQSFPKGFNRPAHPAFWIILLISLTYFINWRALREYLGFSFVPDMFQVSHPFLIMLATYFFV